MGYTHYYYLAQELDYVNFQGVVRDFKKMMPVLEHLGVKLADGGGEGFPEVNRDIICFNGLSKCGHEQRDMGITWPAPTSNGINPNKVGTQLSDLVKGHWFAGAQLESRVCGGDCSHETFCIERKMQVNEWRKEEAEQGKLIFECTKTAFKPYDLAVNVCLIIAKHHLKDQIRISSDGEQKDWAEGAQLCQHFLGYGGDFNIEEQARQNEIDEKKETEQAKQKTLEQTKPKNIDNSTIEINDVFYSSWGYDQTNVEYFKVVGFTKSGKSALVRQIGMKSVPGSDGFMCDVVVPDIDNEIKQRLYSEEAHGYITQKENLPDLRLKIERHEGGVYLRGSVYFGHGSIDSKHLTTLFKYKGDGNHRSWYA